MVRRFVIASGDTQEPDILNFEYRAQHLAEGEQIVYQSPILTRAGIFLPKRRTLVLTSLSRLICVKEDAVKGRIKVESECYTSASSTSPSSQEANTSNKAKMITKVVSKGPRAFQAQTVRAFGGRGLIQMERIC